MDIMLAICDKHILTPYLYPSSWPESHTVRQFISINIVSNVTVTTLYLVMSTINYFLVFDKRLLKHPQILENQVYKEIIRTLKSVPIMIFPSSLMFLYEVKGYSKLYDGFGDSYYDWFRTVCSAVTCLFLVDFLMYWLHRGLHHRLVYATVHKPHHAWKVPTPFASQSYHPIEGFLQGVPYHIYVFFFPMQKQLYIAVYIMLIIWTVSIHNGVCRTPSSLKWILSDTTHHTNHHFYSTCNYGQYFILWDRIGGTFKSPEEFQANGPLDQILKEESCCQQASEDVKGK